MSLDELMLVWVGVEMDKRAHSGRRGGKLIKGSRKEQEATLTESHSRASRVESHKTAAASMLKDFKLD